MKHETTVTVDTMHLGIIVLDHMVKEPKSGDDAMVRPEQVFHNKGENGGGA